MSQRKPNPVDASLQCPSCEFNIPEQFYLAGRFTTGERCRKSVVTFPMPRTARTTSARRAPIRRRIRRAGEQAKTAAQLARAVLAGELRSCAWATLKALYFHGATEEACAAKLARWAERHGIGLEVEPRRMIAGGRELVAYDVRFRRPGTSLASVAGERIIAMADDRTKTGKPDRDRINVNEDYELRDWARKFGVTPQQIKDAVKAVGPMVADVRRHLGK
jgi:hypothetical protein